jgi:ubiquitin-like modifier-activating enzyme ATG7
MAALKFVPFSSEVELPFYYALFASKLDTDKLDDSARPVMGLYEPRWRADEASGTRMQIFGSALTNRE